MEPARRSPRDLALALAAGLAIAFGAWVSYAYCVGAWPADGDIFVTVELWRGVRRHGLGFLSTWNYTQDNWLLSLIPFTSLAYEALGARPEVAVGVGWVVFMTSVGLAGGLGARVAGWRAGLALAAVIVFAGAPALGGAGYLGYPISHNLSMAWGLAALHLALTALQRNSLVAAAAVGVAVLIDTVSDPWAAVAVAAPLCATALGIAVVRPEARRGGLAVAAACVLAVAAARARLFGLLHFLPQSHFELADGPQMLANLYWGAESFAAMFDIVPGPAGRGPEGLISLAALSLVLGASVAIGVRDLRRAGLGRQLVFGAAVLSILATAALYPLGRWDGTLAAGRFFPNVLFLGGLLAATAAAARWRAWPAAPRLALCAYAALFVLGGLTSAPSLWMRTPAAYVPPEARGLAAFLEAQGLAYGYGVFWGSHALLIDTLSEGRVVVRPVTLRGGDVRRRPAETSSLWYRAADEPAASPRRFLILRDDGEECPSVPACEAIAARVFGPPSERLTYRDFVILVWPRSVASRISS